VIVADYNVHVYMRQDGLAGTVTADLEYPPRVAFVLLTQVRRFKNSLLYSTLSKCITRNRKQTYSVGAPGCCCTGWPRPSALCRK